MYFKLSQRKLEVVTVLIILISLYLESFSVFIYLTNIVSDLLQGTLKTTVIVIILLWKDWWF